MAAANLTASRLREVLHYDQATGFFTWLVQKKGPGAAPGKRAGTVNKAGYIVIGVDGASAYGHRLAVLYVTGEWPIKLVDHRDGIKSNNAWLNLRQTDKSGNAQNLHKPHAGNTSGLLGVSWSKRNKTNPWLAQIKAPDGDTINLGYYPTPELGHEAYLAAKQEMHQSFA